MNQAFFVLKLRSVMTDNKFDRVISNRTKGKMDSRILYKARVGSSKIFKHKQERKGKDYSVLLLVDESGSMFTSGRYHKINAAAKMMRFMVDSLQRVQIPCAVVGFNALVRVHKGFDTERDLDELEMEVRNGADHNALIEDEEYIKLLEKAGIDENDGSTACNHDFDALQMAGDMLRARSGKKIMLVISDGIPNCDAGGNNCGDYDQLKHDTEKIRGLVQDIGKGNNVIISGIGVQSDAVERIYPEYFLTQSKNSALLENLMEYIVGFLAKNIKRG